MCGGVALGSVRLVVLRASSAGLGGMCGSFVWQNSCDGLWVAFVGRASLICWDMSFGGRASWWDGGLGGIWARGAVEVIEVGMSSTDGTTIDGHRRQKQQETRATGAAAAGKAAVVGAAAAVQC